MTEPIAPERSEEPVAPSYAPLPTAAPAAKPKRFNAKRLLISLAVLVVVLIGYQVVKHATGNPDVAKAGDCMSGQTGNSLKVVDCGSKADWKVVGKVNDVTDPKSEDGLAQACSQWPTTAAGFWKGQTGEKGYVLCLEPTK